MNLKGLGWEVALGLLVGCQSPEPAVRTGPKAYTLPEVPGLGYRLVQNPRGNLTLSAYTRREGLEARLLLAPAQVHGRREEAFGGPLPSPCPGEGAPSRGWVPSLDASLRRVIPFTAPALPGSKNPTGTFYRDPHASAGHARRTLR